MKTLLLAGKTVPDSDMFADSLTDNRKVAVTGQTTYVDEGSKRRTIAEKKAQMLAFDEEKTKEAQAGICTFEWNQSSSLSARSLILQTENYFDTMDEVVLYFDEEWFASLQKNLDVEEITRTADEMILGFEFLTLEALNRFEKKYESTPFNLVFLLKECPSSADALRSPVLKNGVNVIASPLVAAAASAFTTFAENIAASYGDEPFVNIILARGDVSDDNCKRDESIAQWLLNYLNGVDSLKTKLNSKKSIQWVKPGSKIPTEGFNLSFLKNKFDR